MKYFFLFCKTEFKLLGRTKETWVSVYFFGFLVVLIIDFTFAGETSFVQELVVPLLWTTVLFSGFLRMQRSFEAEGETQIMDSLRLIPHVLMPFYLSKVVVNFLIITSLMLFIFMAMVILFNLFDPLGLLKLIFIPFCLGIFGFCCLGTLFSFMVSANHAKPG